MTPQIRHLNYFLKTKGLEKKLLNCFRALAYHSALPPTSLYGSRLLALLSPILHGSRAPISVRVPKHTSHLRALLCAPPGFSSDGHSPLPELSPIYLIELFLAGPELTIGREGGRCAGKRWEGGRWAEVHAKWHSWAVLNRWEKCEKAGVI